MRFHGSSSSGLSFAQISFNVLSLPIVMVQDLGALRTGAEDQKQLQTARKKHTGSLACALWQQLWSIIWVTQKKHAACHFLLGSHHPVQFHWIRSQHSQNTLPWPLFSRNGMVCPMSLFTQLWNIRETCFYEPGNWELRVKAIFSPMKAGELQV